MPKHTITSPEKLWKSPKNHFFDHRNGKILPAQIPQIVDIENLDFRGYSSTLRVEYTSISEAFNTKNKAVTLPELQKIIFFKSQKNTFFAAKKSKGSKLPYQGPKFESKILTFTQEKYDTFDDL